MAILKIIFHLMIILFLTVLTQIGGLVYLLVLWFSPFKNKNDRWKNLLGFFALYLVFTFLIIPFVAPVFGREKVKVSNLIQPTSRMTVLLNRNYVKPALNDLLANTAEYMSDLDGNIQIRFLDANFPFLDKFPLLPHLSHNDGEKIDISFIYETGSGELTNKKKSISGYGAFALPFKNEINQTNKCKNNGYWQYDFTKYLTLGQLNEELVFSDEGTKKLINSLLKNSSLGKIFIEPHLKQRMNLNSNRIRFHGCQAVRHDDHIHVQLR